LLTAYDMTVMKCQRCICCWSWKFCEFYHKI